MRKVEDRLAPYPLVDMCGFVAMIMCPRELGQIPPMTGNGFDVDAGIPAMERLDRY